jgi:PAS domain S-box-containing protein
VSKALLTDTHIGWVEATVLAILAGAMLVAFIGWTASIIDRGDAERMKAEDELRVSKESIDQILQRVSAPQSDGALRSRVIGGFVVAVAFTAFVGIFSWYSARRAEEDSNWVSHTQDVLTTLETTFRHLTEVETGSRGLALSGHLPILETYERARGEVDTDLATLRRLTADNPSQQHRLDMLKPYIADKLSAAKILVAARRTAGAVPTPQQLDQGKLLMNAAGDIIVEMEAEERRLLLARVQTSGASRRSAVLVLILGALLGMLVLGAAGFAIYHQIDITARATALNDELHKKVQGHATALLESEGRLAGVIQSAMDAILTVDENQKVVLFNAAAERMFQCAASEAMGQPLARFIPQRFHSAHAEHVKKFDETGVTSRAMGVKDALWAVRADGQEFQIEASISQLEAGGKKLFTAVLRDVSERIRAEAAREQFAAVVESSDDAIISKTLDGIITSWNPGAEKIFGYSSTEAVGKLMSIIIPPERASEESHILKEIGLGRGVRHFDTTRLRKDGAYVHVSVTISPIKNSRGEIVGASKIARDITERKLAEEALRESEERFRLFIEYAPAELAMFDRRCAICT